MPKYIVIDGHKKHDGCEYKPGDVIECSEELAKVLRLEPITELNMKKIPKRMPPGENLSKGKANKWHTVPKPT